jgi:hypothetical protein
MFLAPERSFLPVIITELMVIVPAPPMPLIARPRMTIHIWEPTPLPFINNQFLLFQGSDYCVTYLIMHPKANKKYEINRSGLRP